MRAAAIAGIFMAAATATAAAGGAAAVQAPLDVFGRLPVIEDISLSPDGTKIAFVKTVGEQRDLLLVHLGEPQAFGGAHIGDTKLRSIRWMDEDNLLITYSNTALPPVGFLGMEREWFKLATYSVSSRKLAPLEFDVSGIRTFNVVSGNPEVRVVGGKTVLFVPGLYMLRNESLSGLFRYSVADRQMRLIANGFSGTTHWLVDESGGIAAELLYDGQRKVWELKARKGDRMMLVASGEAPVDVPKILGFSAGGDALLLEFIENGDPVWKPLTLKDGTWGAPLEKGAAFRTTITDGKSGRIVGGVRDIDDSHYVFFDAEQQAHWNAILRAFPDERVDLVSQSDDFSKVVVRVFGAKDGFVYSLFDWYTHSANTLGPAYPGVSPAQVRRVGYAAADGLTIQGYLTLPHGPTEQNLPLVVMPHGGPAAADTLRFDWWAQAFAAQGYAVLQPNYRGSFVNHRFMAAGFAQWGRKMQSDLSDGVRYLAQQGIIDPKRVCIAGASYGGYAALAAATFEPGIYRCVVSVAGLSDLKRMLNWTNEKVGHHDNLSQRYWDRFMGVSGPNDPLLREISPIEHVGAVVAPVLLIHGRDDTVVPFEQSDVMAEALRRAGKSVELVTLNHEDHWLSRSATRLQMLEAAVAFVKKYNPVD